MNSTGKLKRRRRTCYIIDKRCDTYHKVKKTGHIVIFGSLEHKLMSLCCDKHFAAYAHVSIVCPLAEDREYYRDIMCQKKIVFLQHGVTQNDYSSALNKYNQNFHSIIASNQEEANSFLMYNYFYGNEQIKLLGLPRHDYLRDSKKKIITFAPTWRRSLFGEFIQETETYLLKDTFESSQYYIFYKELLNNSTLLKTVKEYGYELHFIPHPVFFPYLERMKFHEEVHLHGIEVSYNRMYADSALFVTDYSSAVFDFALLKKPVLYVQFDKAQFYAEQYEKGMFDYEREGFGEVVETCDEAVKLLIKYIQNGCIMKEVYAQRVDSFFAYHDKQNCNRIYQTFYDESETN